MKEKTQSTPTTEEHLPIEGHQIMKKERLKETPTMKEEAITKEGQAMKERDLRKDSITTSEDKQEDSIEMHRIKQSKIQKSEDFLSKTVDPNIKASEVHKEAHTVIDRTTEVLAASSTARCKIARAKKSKFCPA